MVAGPSFAKELAVQVPTAVTVASTSENFACEIKELLQNSYFKPFLSSDHIGVQLGGALKNVITLAVGMMRGAGHGDNACAFVLTCGLAEIAKLIEFRGGRKESAYGLAGMGDLVLTAMGLSSRNLKTGKLLGKGISLDEIKAKLSVLPEGINTVQSLYQLMQQTGIQLPLCQEVYKVVFKGESVDSLIRSLIITD